MDDSAIICDEVIDADAKLSPKNNDKIKTFLTNFNEKKPIFINHYSIIDSCYRFTTQIFIKMSNKFKDIHIKTEHTTFSMAISI